MSIQAVARGRVVSAPVVITSEIGVSTVLLLRDADARDDEVDYQVVCRKPRLGRLVRDSIQIGDLVVVIGTVKLYRVQGPAEDDLSAAQVSFEAVAVARELGSPDTGEALGSASRFRFAPSD